MLIGHEKGDDPETEAPELAIPDLDSPACGLLGVLDADVGELLRFIRASPG